MDKQITTSVVCQFKTHSYTLKEDLMFSDEDYAHVLHRHDNMEYSKNNQYAKHG